METDKPRIRFSIHALQEMEEDKISRHDIATVLGAPEAEGPGHSGRWQAWAKINGRGILVTWAWAQDRESVWIVTVTLQARRFK